MVLAAIVGLMAISVKIPVGSSALAAQRISDQLGVPVVMALDQPVGQELTVPVYEDVPGGLVSGQVKIAQALGLRGEVKGTLVGMAGVSYPASYPRTTALVDPADRVGRLSFEGGKMTLAGVESGEGVMISVGGLGNVMPNTEMHWFLQDMVLAVGMKECLETELAGRVALATGGVLAELESGELLVGVDRGRLREMWVAKLDGSASKPGNPVDDAVLRLKKRLIRGLTDEQITGLLGARGNVAQQLFAPESEVFVQVQKIMRLRYEQLDTIFDSVEREQERAAFFGMYRDVDWGKPVRGQFVSTDIVEVVLQTKGGGWVKGIY